MVGREVWLAERRKGIGGSDAASLFNVGYGCERRLWYDKSGYPEDYPRTNTVLMDMGNLLEDFFAKRFEAETGRTVVTPQEPTMRHPAFHYLRVNLDRLCVGVGSPSVPLEVKAMGASVWYKTRREGLAEDYILQHQHEMLVYGSNEAAFVCGNRDSGLIHAFNQGKDEGIHKAIIAKGAEFWGKVTTGVAPEALDDDDPRCQKCVYRKTCKGAMLMEAAQDSEFVEMPKLEPLLKVLDERSEVLKSVTDEVDAIKEEIGRASCRERV